MSKGIRIFIVTAVWVCWGRAALATTVYWTDKSDNTIRRLDLNGGPIEPLITPADGLGEARGIALDPTAGKLYWSEFDNNIIRVGNMDGTGSPSYFVDPAMDRVRDIVVDAAAGKIYWGDRNANTLTRANLTLDGTGVETLYDSSDGLDRPHGLALDIPEGWMYWTDTRTYAIHRAPLNGVGPVETLASGLTSPWDIAVPEPSCLTLFTLGGLYCRRRRFVSRSNASRV